MPKASAFKCYFGCALGVGVRLHRFPTLNFHHIERFNQWKSVLDSETQAKGDNFIYDAISICNSHFEHYYKLPSNRLTKNAVPTLLISKVQSESCPKDSSKEQQIVEQSALEPAQGLETQAVQSSEEEDDYSVRHEGVLCDNCTDQIFGFRYKCVTCENYDLCQKCEMLEAHSEHYMLRIPKALKFKLAENLIKKWKSFFKSEHVTPESEDISSNCDKAESGVYSDEEPVTKYTRCDSGIDLSEDVKKIMRNEVDRALKAVKDKQKKKTKHKRMNSTKVPEDVPIKKLRTKDNIEMDQETQEVPELVFAHVNTVTYGRSYVKPSIATNTSNNSVIPVQSSIPSVEAPSAGTDTVAKPMYVLKISNDLSQLFIEVAPNITNNLNKLEKPQD